MIKLITLATMVVFSFSCKANTCLVSEENIIRDSEKYSSVVDIKTTINGSFVNVLVMVPTDLNGEILQNILLQKREKSGEEIVLEVPLKVYIEDGKSMSWYNISEDLIHNNFIAIDYGRNCGVSIRYKVN